MSEEKFKQSRRPTNPILNPEDIMAKVEQLEKSQPIVSVDPMKSPTNNPDLPFKMEGNVPPEFAALFNKDNKLPKMAPVAPTPQPGPRLAYTDNPKLNELLEGLKSQTGTYEEVRLPSLSKFYKNGEAPANGIIHVRQMTGEEQEILGTHRFLKKGIALSMIFKNCVREDIQPDKWLTVDRNLLLFFLRGISHGPVYQAEVNCPVCSARFETEFSLDDLRVTFCPKDFGPESLKGELPITKYKFAYQLPTVQHETLINNYRDKRQKEQTEESTDDTMTWRTALLLDNVEGLEEHGALMTLLSRLPIGDVTYLRDTINEEVFGVETKVGQWCASCDSEFEMEMPIGTNFFFPQRKKASRRPAHS